MEKNNTIQRDEPRFSLGEVCHCCYRTGTDLTIVRDNPICATCYSVYLEFAEFPDSTEGDT